LSEPKIIARPSRDYLRSRRPLCVLLMPRDLPGFYFDTEKNRYFPSSSKKEGKSHPSDTARSLAAARPHTSEAASSPSPSSSTPLPQTPRRPTDAWHALQHLRLANGPKQRIAAMQLRFRHSLAISYPNSYSPQMCQQHDDSSARGLSGISGYPYSRRSWPDLHSVCCALSTPKTIYMIMTYTTYRPELTMVAYGPLLVTAMACYIHLILPLWEIFCQRQAMCCNIHGPEVTASILKYVR
jgi:hypothetical protein